MIAEHALQTLHDLHSQCYLGQQIENLLVLLKGLADEMDINLRLAAGGNPVEQGDRFAQEAHQDFVVCILLDLAQGLDTVKMWFATVVETSDLHLISLKDTALDKGCDSRERVAFVKQFITSDTSSALCQIEKVDEGLLLLGGPLKHVDSDVLGTLTAELWGQTQAGLCLGTVTILSLQTCRKSRLIDITNGRHVIVGYPLP